MATNTTEISGYYSSNSSQIITMLNNSASHGHTLLVVLLPILAVLFLFFLLVVDCMVVSHSKKHQERDAARKRKERLDGLKAKIHSQTFKSWVKASHLERGENTSNEEEDVVVCAICLDIITNRALVGGLECHHVFHQSCLDEWFVHFKNFCPLCRQCIIMQEADTTEDQRPLNSQ